VSSFVSNAAIDCSLNMPLTALARTKRKGPLPKRRPPSDARQGHHQQLEASLPHPAQAEAAQSAGAPLSCPAPRRRLVERSDGEEIWAALAWPGPPSPGGRRSSPEQRRAVAAHAASANSGVGRPPACSGIRAAGQLLGPAIVWQDGAAPAGPSTWRRLEKRNGPGAVGAGRTGRCCWIPIPAQQRSSGCCAEQPQGRRRPLLACSCARSSPLRTVNSLACPLAPQTGGPGACHRRSNAQARTLLMDRWRRGQWDPELCDAFGCRAGLPAGACRPCHRPTSGAIYCGELPFGRCADPGQCSASINQACSATTARTLGSRNCWQAG